MGSTAKHEAKARALEHLLLEVTDSIAFVAQGLESKAPDSNQKDVLYGSSNILKTLADTVAHTSDMLTELREEAFPQAEKRG